MRSRVLLGLACALSLGAELTELPRIDGSGFQPLIRKQIERAENEARLQPRSAKAVGQLGMTLHAYKQYEAAEQAYRRAAQLEPGNFDWHYLDGMVSVELGNLAAAVEAFRAALGIAPSAVAAQLRLAESVAATGQWAQAAAAYRTILDKHENFPQAWYGLGRARAAQGDHAGAGQAYARACALFPAYGAAHFALAAELRRLGKSAEAREQVAAYASNQGGEPPLEDPLSRRVYELDLGAQAYLQRGMALEKAGLLEDAIREHEAALAIDPGGEQIHTNLISLYGRTGNSEKAKQHFAIAARLNPGRSDAWYNYGVLLFQEHNFEGAEQAFRRAVSINPRYAEAHNNLGAIYEQQGRLDDAETEFKLALEGEPNYAMAHFHLGRILVNRERYDDAIQQFRRALQPESEQTPAYLYALGSTYSRARDRAQALRYLRQAREAALARGQLPLVTSIDRDLRTLGGEP